MLYRITRITTSEGCPATDDAALRRIGREGYITHLRVGCPMLMAYIGEEDGLTLRTSPVQCVREVGGAESRELQVTTRNNTYTIYGVECADDPGSNLDLE